MLMIDIELLFVIVFHPYIILHRCNIAPYVVGNIDCYQLGQSLSGASISLPKIQEALGVMTFILVSKLSPRIHLMHS